MVADREGSVVAFALGNLQERAQMFVAPGDVVYEGMLAGENARPGDLDVNVTKEKKLTNMRASGSDDNVLLEPPRQITLEYAMEYIEEDELIEVTPQSIRLRKRVLQANDRKKAARAREWPTPSDLRVPLFTLGGGEHAGQRDVDGGHGNAAPVRRRRGRVRERIRPRG